jgi:peptidoglycan/xylan/chitin deacetylase (PgdA/CDA1 family)
MPDELLIRNMARSEVDELVSWAAREGWYAERVSPNTRRLLRELGGFLYDSDAYNDDLPHWLAGSPAHLVIPYPLVNNDARYLLPNGLACADDFFGLLRDGFDLLWKEGAKLPKMMSVWPHGRISDHPPEPDTTTGRLQRDGGNDAQDPDL